MVSSAPASRRAAVRWVMNRDSRLTMTGFFGIKPPWCPTAILTTMIGKHDRICSLPFKLAFRFTNGTKPSASLTWGGGTCEWRGHSRTSALSRVQSVWGDATNTFNIAGSVAQIPRALTTDEVNQYLRNSFQLNKCYLWYWCASGTRVFYSHLFFLFESVFLRDVSVHLCFI